MLKQLVLIVVTAVIIRHGIKLWYLFHLNRSPFLYHHAPGPCVRLQGAENGSEDLTILPNGLVFIASGLMRGEGGIKLLDFTDPTHKIMDLHITGSSFNHSGFVPHGLSVWVNDDTGEVTLMVINHTPKQDLVEVFKYQEKTKTLQHVKSISDRLFKCTNDLVMTSENTFYITKMMLSGHWDIFYQKVEINLFMKTGQVVYFDGTKARSAASGLFLPNGINKSPDGKYIYVSELGGKCLTSYSVNQQGDLELVESLYLDNGMDNIEVEQRTGYLWLSSHPLLYILQDVMSHDYTKGNSDPYSPSQVFKVKAENGKFTDVTEMYLNNGTEIPTVTTATAFNGRMIAGSLISNPLICDLKYDG